MALYAEVLPVIHWSAKYLHHLQLMHFICSEKRKSWPRWDNGMINKHGDNERLNNKVKEGGAHFTLLVVAQVEYVL